MSDSDITFPAFAKINLHLRILEKRADGYHNLDTIFQTISLHDTIRVTATEAPEIKLSCDDRNLASDQTNLIVRAAEALRARFAAKKGARIRLEKRIPVQAGLGGGSADAAVTLLALKQLWQLAATRQDLLEIGSQIGADVPFFLFGGTARGTGVGDEVTELRDLPEQFLLVIKPNACVDTSLAYKAFDERCLTTRNSKTILSSSQPKNVFDDGRLVSLENDFGEVVFSLEPEIARAKAALLHTGAQAAMLAGSGSAVFGIFDSEDAQRRAIQAIKLETGWRVFPCKTVGRNEYHRAFSSVSEAA